MRRNKIAFSGCRNAKWLNDDRLYSVMPCDGSIILVGDCPTGIDSYVRGWCENNMYDYEVFEADWETHGRAAGPIRNREMMREANMLIAFWDGHSKGTLSAIRAALRKGIPIRLYSV